MKISVDDIKIGKFFVKSWMAREIVQDLGDDIGYFSYILESGEPRDDIKEICSKRHMTQWAEREATADEVLRMNKDEARTREKAFLSSIIAAALRDSSAELLLNEIHNRSSTVHDVFISYSHGDKMYVHRLKTELERYNFTPWIDDRIDFGDKWPQVIQDNLNACPTFIIIMTRRAYQSIWVQNEVSYAQLKKKPVFPLLLDGEVWLSLSATQYVDVREGQLPPKEFFSRLKKSIGELL